MGNGINIDQLTKAVTSEMNKFRDLTHTALMEAVDKTTKETVKQIRANVRSNFGGTGEYAKSWTSDIVKLNRSSQYARKVYSRDPHYRLTHLLENGHAKVSGGRVIGTVKGRAHITPAEANAQKMLVDEIKAGIAGR